MGGVHKRSKKHLRFSSLLDSLQQAFTNIPDGRNPEKIKYSLSDIYSYGFALFFLQDRSVLEFQRRCQKETNRNNLSTIFNSKNLPSDTQLRDVIDTHSYTPIKRVFKEYFQRMQRGKYLSTYQYLNSYYLITIDGSQYFTSESINCKKCLHKKQDCERNAVKRILHEIKQDHPHLPIIICGDSLYSNQPYIADLNKHKFSYILVAKPDDHKSLYEDIQGFRRNNFLEKIEKKEKGRIYSTTSNFGEKHKLFLSCRPGNAPHEVSVWRTVVPHGRCCREQGVKLRRNVVHRELLL